MQFVHQIHAVSSSTRGAVEARCGPRGVPPSWASPARGGAVRAVDAGCDPIPEIITLTAVADGAVLEHYGERRGDGDLAGESDALAALRTGVTTRVMTPLKFTSPLVRPRR